MGGIDVLRHDNNSGFVDVFRLNNSYTNYNIATGINDINIAALCHRIWSTLQLLRYRKNRPQYKNVINGRYTEIMWPRAWHAPPTKYLIAASVDPATRLR